MPKGPNYKAELSTSYYLIVRLRADMLHYAVYDPITNTFLLRDELAMQQADEHYAAQEKEMLQNPLFALPYRRVIVSVDTPAYTTLPRALYQKEKACEVLDFLGLPTNPDNDVVNANIIEMAAATLVFVLPKFLHYFLRTQFPQVTVLHSLLPMTQELLMKHKPSDPPHKLNVIINPTRIDVVCAARGILHTLNSFDTQEPTDAVYCVMNLIQHIPARQDEVGITVTTTAPKTQTDQTVTLLRRFARNVSLAARPEHFAYDYPPERNEHIAAELYKIALCV